MESLSGRGHYEAELEVDCVLNLEKNVRVSQC